MPRSLDSLRDEIGKLSIEEQGALADSIWESFLTDEEREIQAAWIVESERRLADMRSGKVKGVPAEEVFARLRAKYGATSRSSRRR